MSEHRVFVWAVAIVLGAAGPAQVSGQSGAAEVKVPRPLPTERPIKGPPADVPAVEPVMEPLPVEGVCPPRRDPEKVDVPNPADPRLPLTVRHAPDVLDYSTPGDGCIWVRAAAYKASFGPRGAKYIPFFGSRAPRNYPVVFTLESIEVGGHPVDFAREVPASRTEDTIVFDRGGVLEAYRMHPCGMEQLFVFDSLPSGGDLVLRVGVETELSAAEKVDGFEFSNELGHVSVGRATTYDARALSTAGTTALRGEIIEIRVPASFLASATFPITIDPLVSTIAIDMSTFANRNPDVAYDATNDRFIVVYDEVYSGADVDVYSMFVTANGSTIPNRYIDSTDYYWDYPKVANNNLANNFLVVAGVFNFQTGSDPGSIQGVTVDAFSGATGPQFVISTGTGPGDNQWPDIGGDPVLAPPTYYFVCWQNEYSGNDNDIFARLVDAAGNLQGSGPIYVDYSTANDNYVHVSKSDGNEPYATQAWTLVWGRGADIWGAQYRWDGSLVHSTFPIETSPSYATHADVSSLLDGWGGERDYLVSYTHDHLQINANIHAKVFTGTTLRSVADISQLEGPGFTQQAQRWSSVDSDGASYAIVYTELYGASQSDYDVYVATVARNGNAMQVAERHVNIDFSSSPASFPSITSTDSGGGGPNRFLLAWQSYLPSSGGDIQGALFDAGIFSSFCSLAGSYFDPTIACPCSNPPASNGRGCNNSSFTGGAQLTAAGAASLSNDALVFTSSGGKPNAITIFWQGSAPSFGGIVFGQGVRCVGGFLKRLYTKTASGGVASAPVGADLAVHVRSAAMGDTIPVASARYYFASYRDPTVLGGCPSTSTFNATQSGSLIWRP